MWREQNLKSGSYVELLVAVVTSCVSLGQSSDFSQQGSEINLLQSELPERKPEVHGVSRKEEKGFKTIDLVYPMLGTVNTLLNKYCLIELIR